MLLITTSDNCFQEIEYILDVVFRDILGLEYKLLKGTKSCIAISKDEKQLVLPDTFFKKASNFWLQKSSLPLIPLAQWDTSELKFSVNILAPIVPVIYGTPGYHITENQINLNLDIFGAAFFMITRYEEIINKSVDQYGRFPAEESIAYQEGFLDRPIINEYIEILWGCLYYLWPKLQRKKRNFRQLISCDVDKPYKCSTNSFIMQSMEITGDLLKRKNIVQAKNNFINFWKIKSGDLSSDPNDTFDLIMDECDKLDIKCAFNFISKVGDTHLSEMDGCYSIKQTVIKNLIKKIADRGHEIGLHPGFNSYLSPIQIKSEFNHLKNICAQLEIHQNDWGGRQHYLRWSNPNTYINWELAELDYDSTLSFPQVAGYRCGICYEFQVYDLSHRRALNLRERPLIVMDVTVLSHLYMNLSGMNALNFMRTLKKQCQQFNGDFTLLWHNSNLINESNIAMFRSILNH